MKTSTIIKRIIMFLSFFIIGNLIGGLGLYFGITAFSHNLFIDGFSFGPFLLNMLKWLIAYNLVYSLPELLKKSKGIVE